MDGGLLGLPGESPRELKCKRRGGHAGPALVLSGWAALGTSPNTSWLLGKSFHLSWRRVTSSEDPKYSALTGPWVPRPGGYPAHMKSVSEGA